jgi:hypothetical protein
MTPATPARPVRGWGSALDNARNRPMIRTLLAYLWQALTHTPTGPDRPWWME